jgi:hypothetical protein
MDCSRPKTRDPDEWVEAAPEFSRGMVEELRSWIQRVGPDLTESIKWNVLCFSGRKLICGLNACKQHASITFFRGTELSDPRGLFTGGEGNTSIRSVRLTSLRRLNWSALEALMLAAVELDQQPQIAPPPKVKREPWPVPEFFSRPLQRNRKALAGFHALSPSCQREWLVWVSSAKRHETREKRLAQTLTALERGRRWIERKLS